MHKGIFSDWSTFTFEGVTAIHGISSKTGLVRGIGMYVESELEFGDDAKLVVHHLSAGDDLYGHDTGNMPRPYAPALAEPIHFVKDWTLPEFNKSFVSSISNEATMDFYCIFGRDGVVPYEPYGIDNVGCMESGDKENKMVFVHRVAPGEGLNGTQRACVLLVAAAFIFGAIYLSTRSGKKHGAAMNERRDSKAEQTPLIFRSSDL